MSGITKELSDQLKDFEFDTTQPLPPEYQDPPGKYRWLKNGVIYDNELKRFVSNKYSVTKPTASNQRGQLLKKARNQHIAQAQAAAQQGMARALGRPDSILEAWGEIVGAQSEHATDISQGSSSVRAAEFVGRATGFMAQDKKDQDSSHNHAQAIGEAVLDEILSRMGILPDMDDDQPTIIDAEFQ